MSKITEIKAREIIDSRGNPTIEVDLTLGNQFFGRAAVPSGASTGAFEAWELRDKDPKRYLGKGVLQAVNNITDILGSKLIGEDLKDQRSLDQLILDIDGTPEKKNLGANALLGVSLAFAKANAVKMDIPFFKSFFPDSNNFKLPVPLMNVLNGGAHADNGLDIQEFMVVPVLGDSFAEGLRCGCEIFQNLKKILTEKKLTTSVGDEGGFAPKLESNREALELLSMAVEKAGYKLGDEVFFALDVASTELFNDGKYNWEGKTISGPDLNEVYENWAGEFPLISIEDGFAEEDWENWKLATSKLGDKLQLVGDDLFVTNPSRLERGISERAANSLLVKVNQIGTLTETMKAVTMAHDAGFNTVMSHRSGETEDVTISHLAVGLGCAQIKTGSLCRGERTAKYNELLRIEELIGKNKYMGKSAFKGIL